jgi:hypothetical protein
MEHFLLQCPAYGDHRHELMHKLENAQPHKFRTFQNLPTNKQAWALINDEGLDVNGTEGPQTRWVASFVFKAWSARSNFLAQVQAGLANEDSGRQQEATAAPRGGDDGLARTQGVPGPSAAAAAHVVAGRAAGSAAGGRAVPQQESTAVAEGAARSGSMAYTFSTQDVAPHMLMTASASACRQQHQLPAPASFNVMTDSMLCAKGFGGVFPRRVVSAPPAHVVDRCADLSTDTTARLHEREADGGDSVAL